MALANVHRFTSDEFLALEGLPERVELIDGIISDMAPEGPRHAVAQVDIATALKAALPDFVVAGGGSLRCPDGFCPIPDVAVYASMPDEGGWFDVNDALLVVEVGVATRDRDRTFKVDRYARAGLQRLWLVAPTDGTLTLLREPTRDAGPYADVTTLRWPGDLQTAVAQLVPDLLR